MSAIAGHQRPLRVRLLPNAAECSRVDDGRRRRFSIGPCTAMSGRSTDDQQSPTIHCAPEFAGSLMLIKAWNRSSTIDGVAPAVDGEAM